jgi:hypothetical protein
LGRRWANAGARESSIKDLSNILESTIPVLLTFYIKDENGATFHAESCLKYIELRSGYQLSPNMTELDSLDIISFVTKALHEAETKAGINDNQVSTSDPTEERGRSRAYEEDLYKGLSACLCCLPFSSPVYSSLGGRHGPDILSILHGPGT